MMCEPVGRFIVMLAAGAAVVPFGTFVIDRRLREWDADPSGVVAAHRRLGEALKQVAQHQGVDASGTSMGPG